MELSDNTQFYWMMHCKLQEFTAGLGDLKPSQSRHHALGAPRDGCRQARQRRQDTLGCTFAVMKNSESNQIIPPIQLRRPPPPL